MKNLLYSLAASIISFTVYSQLNISSNSFIFNKGSLLYVTGKIEIKNAGNLYLRNNGQLLQGDKINSINTGEGKLSVLQEGTSNNFIYNYWCSPIGNASTANGNEDFGVTMLHIPTTKTTSNPANMTSGLNGTSSNGSLTISTYWIWRFLSSINNSQWIHSAATSNIAPGQGFTMKGTNGTDNTDIGEDSVNNPGSAQRYDFRGKPNDGNINVDVATDGFTLTGNPYPSALHVNAFLLDESNGACDRIAYYWEQKPINTHVLQNYQGGYGTYSPISYESNGIYVPATFSTYNSDGTINNIGSSSGLNIERKYAPIGQGFMIKGITNGTVTLRNEHRTFKKEGDYSNFYRQETQTNPVINVSQIRLNATINNLNTTQIALAFIPTASDSIDNGIDAESPVSSSIPDDVYFTINNKKFVIQGIDFNVNKRIAIGVKSSNNSVFKFRIAHILNFDQTQPIYLFDNENNTYHDIKNNDYELMIPTGIYNNRFEITFTNSATLNIINSDKSSLFIVNNNRERTLTINNPKLIELTSIKIYEINGKAIFDKTRLDTKEYYQFSTNELSNGIYLVEILTNNNQKIVKKIML